MDLKQTLICLCILLLAFIFGCNQDNITIPPSKSPQCSVVASEAGATITCPDGTTASIVNGLNGTNGTNGSDGSNGTNGSNGVNGSDGAPGTIITTVKLCADDTSGFPEYAVRIGGQLYAVYWDVSKGAFLALLTPGRYMSTNGTGCLFGVTSDGEVVP